MVGRSKSEGLKSRWLKLEQLEATYPQKALAVVGRSIDGLEALLTKTPSHKVDALIDQLLPPVLIVAIASDSKPSYVSLDIPHLISVFQAFAPQKKIRCFILEGMTRRQIEQKQIRPALLHAIYHRCKNSDLLHLAKALDENSFIDNKQLASLTGISEASLYPPKKQQRSLPEDPSHKSKRFAPVLDIPDFGDL